MAVVVNPGLDRSGRIEHQGRAADVGERCWWTGSPWRWSRASDEPVVDLCLAATAGVRDQVGRPFHEERIGHREIVCFGNIEGVPAIVGLGAKAMTSVGSLVAASLHANMAVQVAGNENVLVGSDRLEIYVSQNSSFSTLGRFACGA
ncbi:hypothetical protein QTP70_025990 [Hemibagrus guttatus]|uniref:Uncharacterized protein n=1 Tax=Hemibagrus guttatus TaxID=175788 RepID=A0AAE0R652_9TELE|nr:hypothetical protein QTP70_025990 [Hemibagrus guttatus]